MNSNEAECRRAFDRFLGELRLECFSMYEGLRDVQIGADDETQSRLRRLSEVALSAARVQSQIEQLFAAVWFELEEEPTYRVVPRRAREYANAS